MTRRRRLLAAAALAVVGLAVAFATHLITADHYRGTWGLSIGTDTAYCSVELDQPPSCQSGS